jgi:penicillin-binding protein 2
MTNLSGKKFIFYAAFTLLFAFLLIELFYLQIYKGQKYLQHSESNRIRRYVIQPTRGLIYDRQGDILVDNTPSYSLSAIPFECNKNDSVLTILSNILHTPEQTLKKELRQADSPFSPVKIKRNIDYSTLVQVEERRLELPGVIYDVDPKRMYPYGVRAPHLFGYLGEIAKSELERRSEENLRAGDYVGKSGIEKVYDRLLRGSVGYDFLEVDALGREIRDIHLEGEKAPKRGADLYLTLDAELQLLAEKSLEGSRGSVVMLDVRNGQVLVMTSKPDYDPHIFADVVTNKVWRELVNNEDRPLYDRAVQSAFPPGSTFKLVLAAAALEQGVVTPSYSVVCPGYMQFGRRVFHCWNAGGHGRVDMLHAIEQSCNVYFYNLSLKVNVDEWAEFARRFGFGKRTGIDLLHEVSGLVPDSEYMNKTYGKRGWTRGNMLNLGIGQGDLLTTPLQLAQFAAMMANRGHYFEPHLMYKSVHIEQQDTTFFQPVPHEVNGITPETYEVLIEGTNMVIHGDMGTGKAAGVRGVSMCGKTGTAQNPHGEPHAWFIGFGPAQDPRVAICVLVENGGGGGANAAPIAGKVLGRYFEKYPVLKEKFASRD